MKKQKVIFSIGVPGSGKTTWAKELIKDTSYRRANRDEIRELFGDKKLSLTNSFEKEVTMVQHAMILIALEKGYNVVVDDTNLNKKSINKLKELVQNFCDKVNVSIDFERKTFPLEMSVCIDRDKKRGEDGGRTVGKNVIEMMNEKYLKGVSDGWVKDFNETLSGNLK